MTFSSHLPQSSRCLLRTIFFCFSKKLLIQPNFYSTRTFTTLIVAVLTLIKVFPFFSLLFRIASPTTEFLFFSVDRQILILSCFTFVFFSYLFSSVIHPPRTESTLQRVSFTSDADERSQVTEETLKRGTVFRESQGKIEWTSLVVGERGRLEEEKLSGFGRFKSPRGEKLVQVVLAARNLKFAFLLDFAMPRSPASKRRRISRGGWMLMQRQH